MNIDHKFSQSIAGVALTTGLLLLIPLLAMQFSDGVAWTLIDFLIAGFLLFGTGLTYTLVTRKTEKTAYRIAVGFALLTGLVLVWVNLAVGLIGSEENPINLMYFGVLAVGIIGAIIVRFQSQGMVGTMAAVAFAQALAGVIALISDMHRSPNSSVTEILGVNGFFIVLFIVSALLFRFAAQEQSSSNVEPQR
jgi:hypothetical protein